MTKVFLFNYDKFQGANSFIRQQGSYMSGKCQGIIFFFLCPHHFQWGGRRRGGHIISSPLSVHTSVRSSYPSRPVRPVLNTNGFCAISFEKIGVLD